MTHLDGRKETILQAVVKTYVKSAEPVGSQYLASQGWAGVRAATIRHEMAAMTRLGYLDQPHPSAGRLPSTRGYRYFVDRLMAETTLSPAQQRRIRQPQELNEGDLDQLLSQTCRALASLTGMTSLASPPQGEAPRLKQIHLAPISPLRLLLVMVLENGHVAHRFVRLEREMTPAQVTRLNNAANALFAGLDMPTSVLVEAPRLPDVRHEALEDVRALIKPILEEHHGRIFMEGTGRMLVEPEFREPERTSAVVKLLEERRNLYETVRALMRQGQMVVSIGDENPHEAMHELSLVAAPYTAGPGLSGWVGVMGPTRMRYEHTVPAVRYTAQALSETLEQWNC